MNVTHQILKAAEELFFRYGVKSITMDDIAKHLGMSKRTIYENYSAKDDIVQELLLVHRNKIVYDIETYRQKSKDAIEEIILNMHHLKDLSDIMNARLLLELKKFHPKAWSEYQKFKRTILIHYTSDNLKRGIMQGIYRKDIDIDILSRLSIEQIELNWNPEIFPNTRQDIIRIQLVILYHFMHGIVNIKGYRLIEKYMKSNLFPALLQR
jgi:AcrR family transcriptional regulator